MGILHRLYRSVRGPAHHLDPDEKQWVESRFLWLHEQFGEQVVCREPLTPGSDVLPRSWDCSHEAATDLTQRLCRFMQVDFSRVHLEIGFASEMDEVSSMYAGETSRSGPAGLFFPCGDTSKVGLAIREENLGDPEGLVATICHELAHVHLLADKRISRDEPDCEPLTDLLTVYFGAGIFGANTALRFRQWQDDSQQGWNTSALGYLSESIWGYALAAHAWMRGEERPTWSRHIRHNVHYYFDDAIHFLTKTRETRLPRGNGR